MKKFLIVIIFLTSSCGYQPIYINKTLQNYEFEKIIFEGDNYINKKIVNMLAIKESNENNNKNKLTISSSYKIEEVSKNSKGQVELYKSTINVNLKINDNNKKIIQNRNFVKEFTYNNKQNKFNLTEYQNSIKNNLIDKIISDIIIFLSSK